MVLVKQHFIKQLLPKIICWNTAVLAALWNAALLPSPTPQSFLSSRGLYLQCYTKGLVVSTFLFSYFQTASIVCLLTDLNNILLEIPPASFPPPKVTNQFGLISVQNQNRIVKTHISFKCCFCSPASLNWTSTFCTLASRHSNTGEHALSKLWNNRF